MLKSKLTTTLCETLVAASMLTACGSTPAAQESTSTASTASAETTQTEVKEVSLTAMANLQGEQATILEAMLKASSASDFQN